MELTFDNIEKSFSDKHVLKGISFTAKSKRAFGFLGRNGAGKTTTIRILMNVFPMDSGKILLDGSAINYDKVKIGYLPEERGMYQKKKIFDQLLYFAMLKDMTKKDAANKIDYWLNRLNMTEYRNKRLDTLSKGNQQKIQLITAVVFDPDIIILDEPFSGLDPVNAMLLKDVVKEEINKGKLVLFSSHQMNYIEEFCDDIAIINNGKIAITGNLHDIKKSYPRNKLVVTSDDSEKIMSDYGKNCQMREDKSLLITMDNPEDKKTTMSSLSSSYNIDSMYIFEPSLNDIFVEYTENAV